MSLQHLPQNAYGSRHSTIYPHQPLSLQRTSILYVVTNLELFPPDMLALLPLKFRRELLLLLPPADIFQLEQTGVVDGIDMENEVWKVVWEQYDFEVARNANRDQYSGMMYMRASAYPQPFPKEIELMKQIVKDTISWKLRFLTCIFAFLLHMEPHQLDFTAYDDICSNYASSASKRNYIVFLQLLFAKRFFTLTEIREQGGFTIRVFGIPIILARFSRLVDSQLTISNWICFFLAKCGQEPPKTISIEQRYFSWHETSVTKESLSLFFKCIKSIDLTLGHPLSARDQVDSSPDMLMWLFEMVQSFSESPVESIKFVEQSNSYSGASRFLNTFSDSDIFAISQAFRKLVVPSTIPAVSHLFQSLKHIAVKGGPETRFSQSSLNSLLGHLQNPSLELFVVGDLQVSNRESNPFLDLEETSPTQTPEEVSISPTLATILLNDVIKLPFSLLLWLVQAFLFSPSNAPQRLALTHCEIDCQQLSVETRAQLLKLGSQSSLSRTPLPNKSLHIAYLSLEPILLQMLSNLPLLALDGLELETNIDSWTGKVQPHDLFTAVFNGKKKSVKSFSYHFNKRYDDSLRHSLTPNEMKEIKTFLTFVKQLPKTAITLKCTLSSNYMKALITCLFTEWKKIGGNTKLHKLVIQFNSLVGGSGGFKSMLESTISEYPITMMAKTVEVNAGSSIVKCNTILSYQEGSDRLLLL